MEKMRSGKRYTGRNSCFSEIAVRTMAIYHVICGLFLSQFIKEAVKTAKNSTGNLDRQLEEAAGSLFRFIGWTIAEFLKGVFRGIKKLNKWQSWIGLGVTALISFLAYHFKPRIWLIDSPAYIKWLLYAALLFAPVIYVLALGGFQGKSKQDYERMFSDIGFVGKDGKTPEYRGEKADGKKTILSFRSNIPLVDWKTARARLETALDCNILKLEYAKSKKVVQLTTLPSDYEIPKKVSWSDSFCSTQSGVLTIGQSALGSISFDLNRVPHVLAAGETGSGKSVILRCMLWQMIQQGSKVFMIDFKGGVEFGKQYERFGEVITDRSRALEVLEMLVQENEYRLKIFRDLEVKNLSEYNRRTGQNLCRIGVFTDEIAEMLDKKGVSKEKRQIYEALEGKLSTLARLSRATGINLFMGVQRPDANILTGQIKNNIPVRISGRFADKAASEIVLGNTDAVDLPDIKGRFLYKVGNETIEFQAYFFDDETMLHDVDVEVGTMLTEAPVYTPDKIEKPERWAEQEGTEKSNASDKGKARKGKAVRKKAQKSAKPQSDMDFEDYRDSEICQDSGGYAGSFLGEEEELPFGDPMVMDEMDFDFSRDWRNREDTEGKEEQD